MGLRSHKSGKGRGLLHSQRGVGRRVVACAAEAQGFPRCPSGAVTSPWWLKHQSRGPRLRLSLVSCWMRATPWVPACESVVTLPRPLCFRRKRIEKAKKEAKKAEKKRKREEKKAKKAAKKAAQKAEEEAKRAEKERKVGPWGAGVACGPAGTRLASARAAAGKPGVFAAVQL